MSEATTGANVRPRELSAEEYVRREEEKARLAEGGRRWHDYLLRQIKARRTVAASAAAQKQRAAAALAAPRD